MYMIEITEDKVSKLYENIEKGLRYMGKAMQCAEELKSESGRSHHHYDDEEDEEDMRERRGKGRYSRY